MLIAGVNHFRDVTRLELFGVALDEVLGCVRHFQALRGLSLKLIICVLQAQNKGTCHGY